MKSNPVIKIEQGNISEYLKVVDCALRWIADNDQYLLHQQPEKQSDFSSKTPVVQGHIQNISRYAIEDVIVDISYFNKQDTFLGLDTAGFFDIGFSELEPGQMVPFEIDLIIPEDTVICYINAAAKKAIPDNLLKWLLRKE